MVNPFTHFPWGRPTPSGRARIPIYSANLIMLNLASCDTCSLMTLSTAALYWSNCCGDMFRISSTRHAVFSSMTPKMRLLSVVNHSRRRLYRQMACVKRDSICLRPSFVHASWGEKKQTPSLEKFFEDHLTITSWNECELKILVKVIQFKISISHNFITYLNGNYEEV